MSNEKATATFNVRFKGEPLLKLLRYTLTKGIVWGLINREEALWIAKKCCKQIYKLGLEVKRVA